MGMGLLFEMGKEMQQIRDHMNVLTARVDHISRIPMAVSPSPHPERGPEGLTPLPSSQPNTSATEGSFAGSHVFVDADKMDSAMPHSSQRVLLPNSIPVQE